MAPASEQFRLFFESAPNGVVAVDADGQIVYVNARTERMFGYRREELIGQSLEILVPERFCAGHRDLRKLFALAPQTRPMGAGRDLFARRKDGSEFPVEIGLNPIASGGEAGGLVVANVVDISERKQAEERRKLLIGELNHRIRNLFTVVQAVATNSLSGERTLAEARDSFLDRLDSLARAYTILTEQHWQGAPLKQILQAELLAFSERVDLDGPDVMVRQISAQSFALLFHELATNAVKYGALSGPAGRISIRWRVDRSVRPATFFFSWEESGGPTIAPPQRTGYGRKIIQDTARRLGKHRIDYAPEGLKYAVEGMLDKVGWVTE